MGVLFQIADGHIVANVHFALVRRIFTAQHTDQRGFTGTVFSDNANAVFFFYRGGDAMQNHTLAKAFTKLLQSDQHSFTILTLYLKKYRRNQMLRRCCHSFYIASF